MKEYYDYIIVGSGLFGATFAYIATNHKKKCLVIEKRSEVGGNVLCEDINGIVVHKFGPHIFHTNDKAIWDFVNTFVPFEPFIYSPIANNNGVLYNLPFNMNTFCKIWKDVRTPKEAEERIKSQSSIIKNEPRNLEEQAIKLVGTDIYDLLIKGYTEKQWGCKCSELPPFIIKRIPVRFSFDNNYFNDKYQGIPVGSYNVIINKMLEKSDLSLKIDFNNHKQALFPQAKKIIYTGSIDSLFDYSLGKLSYRSLCFKNEIIKTNNFQGCAAMNFTDSIVPFTRITEHKHFDRYCKNENETVITKEYSIFSSSYQEPYYPINNETNDDLYLKYLDLSNKTYGDKIIFGGRLGDYRYYNMDETIKNAIDTYESLNI